MPELPEVETMVRGIRPTLAGRVVADVSECPCDRKPITVEPSIDVIRERIAGQRVDTVSRLAKRVVVSFESGDRFVVEPRMTGLMLVADPPTTEHLRLRIEIADDAGSVWFWDRRGLGTARLYAPDEFDWALGPDRIGPDALVMTIDEWWTRCRATRRAIKVAMLDQRMVAGIGNLYASEILHRAGVHPARRADRIGRARIAAIREATVAVMTEAIHYEGSTLGDGTYRNALNTEGGYQNHHRVYARAGESCPRCGGTIRRTVQCQRATFHCPGCQR